MTDGTGKETTKGVIDTIGDTSRSIRETSLSEINLDLETRLLNDWYPKWQANPEGPDINDVYLLMGERGFFKTLVAIYVDAAAALAVCYSMDADMGLSSEEKLYARRILTTAGVLMVAQVAIANVLGSLESLGSMTTALVFMDSTVEFDDDAQQDFLAARFKEMQYDGDEEPPGTSQ